MIRPTARHVLPEFHERTTLGMRVLDPYSKLLGERIVFLGTPIDDTAANDVIAQLMHLEHAAPDQDVSVYINSPGGSFTAMTSVYDAMQFISCDVETVCLGQAASAAAVLLAAGTPGKRLVLPGSRVMIHQPSLTEPVRGTSRDLEIQAEEVARTRTLLEQLLARHTGRSREEVGEDIEHDKFLTAQGAVDYGIADRVVASRKAARLRVAG